MSTERDRLYGVDDTEKFLWCLHCERTYRKGEHRVSKRGEQVCAYRDCDGDTVLDAWNWQKVRDGLEDQYPEEPVHGVVYPLYGKTLPKFIEAPGRWIKATRQAQTMCEAAGCQKFIDRGEWYWRDGPCFAMCEACATDGGTWTSTGRDGLQVSWKIPAPPYAR